LGRKNGTVTPESLNPEMWERGVWVPPQAMSRFDAARYCSTHGAAKSASCVVRGKFVNSLGRRATRNFCLECARKLPAAIRPEDLPSA
jgi:hypothetical protein